MEEAKGKSLHSIAKKYGIDRKSIRDWSNQEEQLKEQLNYKKYRITGGGAKSQLSKENELDIVNWIIQTRIRITSNKYTCNEIYFKNCS